MSVAVAQVLEGVPDASHLRLVEVEGRRVVMVGARALFAFEPGDLGMRNVAVVALTELRFQGTDVAAMFGLTPTYVSQLRGRVRDEGSAGLVRDRGRPRKLTSERLEQAAAWRAQGWTDVQIGARLGVAGTTIGRRLGPATAAPGETVETATVVDGPGELDLAGAGAADEAAEVASPAAPEEPGSVESEPLVGAVTGGADEPDTLAGAAQGAAFGLGSARIAEGVVGCRWAGAMLVHAFTHRLDVTRILTEALGEGGEGARYDDVAVLAATSMAFTLGAGTVEGIKHLAIAQAGALCALARMPALSTLRPRLADLAERVDPLALQRALATALLTADPDTSGIYYVDDHFVPYAGAKPVGKGWDTKHRRVARGRADTYITDSRGRALVFTSGEPSGLTKTLPAALAELRAVTGPDARILLGFDRGGAYPSVFTACRAAGADWVTYRRAPLVAPTRLPLVAATTPADAGEGGARALVYADEPVPIDGYGTARQITWFENGTVAMQVLTSDLTACPVALLRTLKSRWRIENAFKYAAEYFGIDALADYLADIETNTRPVDNPARKRATTAVGKAEAELAEAERALARLLSDPSLSVSIKNEAIPTIEQRIARAAAALTSAQTKRDAIPAKLPANEIDPDATRALLRTRRRALQMVLRLLAYNGEHYLATALNAYLRDGDEYRALTRATILRGTAGTITYTPDRIDVVLERPHSPRLARALDLLLKEINTTPPSIPGDNRQIAYHLAPG